MATKKNVTVKVNIVMKARAAKVALEVVAHVASAVVLVQVELRKRKIANAQLGFFESSSRLLQTFVALESQTEERILERIEVKVERIEKEHGRHNSGGVGRAVVTMSMDDESSKSCNSNSKELG